MEWFSGSIRVKKGDLNVVIPKKGSYKSVDCFDIHPQLRM